jgi:hypothetical protein
VLNYKIGSSPGTNPPLQTIHPAHLWYRKKEDGRGFRDRLM